MRIFIYLFVFHRFMGFFDTDLHIHSPHSIAVSKNLNLDTMVDTCTKKGLSILGTGDITQPDWRKYLANNLERSNEVYTYKNVNFIIQTELEDEESVHHVILLPDIKAGEELQNKIEPKCKDVRGNYAGRPHVHLSPVEIVELVDNVGGVCGPAHAFTPFKAIFRPGKFSNLEECFGSALNKVPFIELGLSADTDLADRLKCLENVSFLSNSDAHSEGIQSLGREFNRFDIEEPSFEEILSALKRKEGRKIVLNVGMEPRLGKYPMLFCRRCRRRIFLEIGDEKSTGKDLKTSTLAEKYQIDDKFIHYYFENEAARNTFKQSISKGKIKCPACLKEKKNSKINLGVFDRIDEIADYKEPRHPDHRPPYLDIIPLVEMIRVLSGVKSVKSKSVIKQYNSLIDTYGTEFEILTNEEVQKRIQNDHEKLGKMIGAFMKRQIEFIPGGGGKYGEIILGDLD